MVTNRTIGIEGVSCNYRESFFFSIMYKVLTH